MNVPKKWMLAAVVAIIGLGMLRVASVTAARADDFEMAEIAQGRNFGQFGGACNQEMLHIFFCVTLVFVFAAGLLAFLIAKHLTRRFLKLATIRERDLVFWCMVVPLVGDVFLGSALLWRDSVRLLKAAEYSASESGAFPRS